jgi:tetratricopeptide (TPR) repeat protein
MCFSNSMKLISGLLAIFFLSLVPDTPAHAAGPYTLRGAVITTDGTMVPEFTVTVRPLVSRPELVLRKRFQNGVFRIDGLANRGYQIQIDSRRHARIQIQVDFKQIKEPTAFRTLILPYPVDRTESSLQAAAASSPPRTSTDISDTSRSPCDEAMEAIGTARPEEALVSLGSCLRTFPNNVPALTAMGSIYLSLDRPDAALAYLRQANRVDPSRAEVQLGMALAYRAKSNFGEAAKLLEPLAADPAFRCRALYHLADVYFEQSRNSLAELTARNALQENPRMLEAWLLLVNLAIEQKNPEGIREGLTELRGAINNRAFTDFVNDQLEAMNQ